MIADQNRASAAPSGQLTLPDSGFWPSTNPRNARGAFDSVCIDRHRPTTPVPRNRGEFLEATLLPEPVEPSDFSSRFCDNRPTNLVTRGVFTTAHFRCFRHA